VATTSAFTGQFENEKTRSEFIRLISADLMNDKKRLFIQGTDLTTHGLNQVERKQETHKTGRSSRLFFILHGLQDAGSCFYDPFCPGNNSVHLKIMFIL
jgi:hypothetical protein